MQLPSLRSLLLPALLVVAACGEDPVPEPDPGTTCDTNQAEANLDWIQENIMTPSCSDFSVCHMGRALMAAELSLEDGETHGQLVGQPSVLFEEYTRVVPGEPENSYLMMILGHIDGPLTDKGTMPYNSPLLSFEYREAIWCWIEAGAAE